MRRRGFRDVQGGIASEWPKEDLSAGLFLTTLFVSRPWFQQSSEPGALDHGKQSVAVSVDCLGHEEAQATTLFCLSSLPGQLLPALTSAEVSGRCSDAGTCTPKFRLMGRLGIWKAE